MANVLVLGVGPLPAEKTQKIHAPGIRTWHLARTIARRRHNVLIGLIEFGDFQDGSAATAITRPESIADNISLCRLKYDSRQTPDSLATMHVRARFTSVVSTTDIMNSVAAAIPMQLPLWLDYLGDPFTEKQIMAATFDNDASLMDQWRLLFQALSRGDRFSVASTPQKFALIGQLGMVGRLNQFTSGTELIHILPNCSRVMTEKESHVRVQLKGRSLPQECFLLLWSGGYNTWTDPTTLFEGVAGAMREEPLLHYVTAGGEIAGHDNVTFQRFRNLVEASDLAPRFHFLGWIPNDEMPGYYRQADAALNVDANCYEAEIGTRTRLIDWALFEVPIITTALCEPARLMEQQGMIQSFRAGDAASLAQAILRTMRDRQSAKARAHLTREYILSEFDEETAFAPLLEWVENPAFAPDRIITNRVEEHIPEVDSALVALHQRFLSTPAAHQPERGRESLLSRLRKKVSRNTG